MLLVTASQPACAAAVDYLLLIVVNGTEGDVYAVHADGDGALSMHRGDLVALRVPLPPGAGDEVRLDKLPGTHVAFDAPHQRLALDFAIHDRKRNRIDLTRTVDDAPITPSATGFLVNYDLVATRDRIGTSAGGVVEARLFAAPGTLSTTAIANTRAFAGQSNFVRLDTSFTTTDPVRLRRYTAGDLISGGLQSSRSVRLAGFQVSTDFTIRPDLITYPVPLLSGSAAVPSTVDVLVNGSRVGGGPVAAGDFAVSGVPVVNGSGTVDVVVRDALGRESRAQFNIYSGRTLLAPGLTACTLDGGAVRRGYALRSNDYRFIAGTATCRAGVSDRLTLEGHGEATSDLALAGGGAVIGLGRLGVLSLGASLSTAATGRGAMQGAQISLGYELIARPVSFSVYAVEATDGYRDVAARAGDSPSRSSVLANLGFDLRRYGSLSVGFARLDGSPPSGPQAAAFAQRSGGLATTYLRASLVTGTYTVGAGRGINVYANVLHDIDQARSTIAVVGISIALDRRTTAVASGVARVGATSGSAEVVRAVTEPGEVGYRINEDRGAVARDLAEGRYRATWGEVSAGIEHVGTAVAVRVGASGSIVVSGGGIMPGNTLNGSFAVVDTGLPDVAVLRDNRPAGRSDAGGRLLIPDLRAFEANMIAIDPLSLPEDALPGTTRLSVRPRDRTGVIARFAAHRIRATRVRLTDAAGAALEPGGRARLNGGEAVPVGYDGEAFLDDLKHDNRIEVLRTDGKTCTVTVVVADGPLPAVIGPLACR